MDESQVKVDMMFGSIEFLEIPPRIEGKYLYPRGRTIRRDLDGNITSDESYDIGTRIENWESVASVFGVKDPRTWWQRLFPFLC